MQDLGPYKYIGRPVNVNVCVQASPLTVFLYINTTVVIAPCYYSVSYDL